MSGDSRASPDGALAGDALRLLVALCAASRRLDQGAVLPLRSIANWTFEGDTQRAAAMLSSLDAAGYIRTDTMGWYRGWVTDKGLSAAPAPEGSED
jgi:hypothetical protein